MVAPAAVCIACGTFKPSPLRKCAACGFRPSSAEDQARSLLLSREFDAGEEVVGLSPQQLEAAGREIQAGNHYRFDPAMVARVASLHSEARAITPGRLAVDLARWLLPPSVILIFVYWLLWRH